jgi:hypothetical protein
MQEKKENDEPLQNNLTNFKKKQLKDKDSILKKSFLMTRMNMSLSRQDIKNYKNLLKAVTEIICYSKRACNALQKGIEFISTNKSKIFPKRASSFNSDILSDYYNFYEKSSNFTIFYLIYQNKLLNAMENVIKRQGRLEKKLLDFLHVSNDEIILHKKDIDNYQKYLLSLIDTKNINILKMSGISNIIDELILYLHSSNNNEVIHDLFEVTLPEIYENSVTSKLGASAGNFDFLGIENQKRSVDIVTQFEQSIILASQYPTRLKLLLREIINYSNQVCVIFDKTALTKLIEIQKYIHEQCVKYNNINREEQQDTIKNSIPLKLNLIKIKQQSTADIMSRIKENAIDAALFYQDAQQSALCQLINRLIDLNKKVQTNDSNTLLEITNLINTHSFYQLKNIFHELEVICSERYIQTTNINFHKNKEKNNHNRPLQNIKSNFISKKLKHHLARQQKRNDRAIEDENKIDIIYLCNALNLINKHLLKFNGNDSLCFSFSFQNDAITNALDIILESKSVTPRNLLSMR